MAPGRARGAPAAALAAAALAALLPSAAAQSAALDLVLVRVGNAAWPAANSTPGTTLPVFADSYARADFTSNFSLSYTLSAPTAAGTPGQSLCTLPAGTSTPAGGDVRYHDIEGTPAAFFTPLLAQVGAWPCYALPPGASVLTGTGPTVAATIAQLASSGRLDTGLSLRLDDAAPGAFTTGLRSSLSTDVGASFAVAGVTGPSVDGWPIWKRAYLNATAYSAPMYGSQSMAAAVPALDLRGFVVSSLDRVTYAYGVGSARTSTPEAAAAASLSQKVGVWRVDISTTNAACANASAAFWAGTPVLTSGCVSLLPGFNGTVFHNEDGANSTVRVAWALTFDTSGGLWVSVENADPVTGGRGVLYNYNYDGSTYGFNTDKSRVLSATEPLLSVVSREDRPPGGNRIMWIYAASRSTAYRYDSTNKLAYTLAVAPAGSVFRGVLLQPGGQYTPSITPSTTPTGSITASATSSTSLSATATSTASRTASPTSSSTAIPSDTATSTASNTATTTSTASQTATSTGTPPPTATASETASSTGTPTSTSSRTASATASVSSTATATSSVSSTATATVSVSSTASPTGSVSASATRTPTPSSTRTGSTTATPSGTASPSQTPSRTATGSSTPSGTPTVSPPPQPIGRGSIIVVRLINVGDVNVNDTGAKAVVFDVVNPEAAFTASQPLVRTIRVPWFADSSKPPCTLGLSLGPGWLADTDGLPSMSPDGVVMTIPCFATASGTTLSMDTPKVIATLNWTGAVGLSNRLADTYGGFAFGARSGVRTAVARDGSGYGGYYMAGMSSYAWGFRWVASLGSNTSVYVIGENDGDPGLNDARWVGVYANQLYGASSLLDVGWNGVFSLGSGTPSGSELPLTFLDAKPVLSLADATQSVWSFLWENATSLWVALDGDPSWVGALANYVKPPGSAASFTAWPRAQRIGLTPRPGGAPVYSISSRIEDFPYDAANDWAPELVLYASSSTTVWRYFTVTRNLTTIYSVPTGSVFRGVAVAPREVLSPTGTPTLTASRTASRTATPSSTASSTGTPTASRSALSTDTASSTSTSSATQTASRTSTSTSTRTASSTATSSQTSTASQTSSATSTASRTGTATASSTSSQTSTPSQTSTSTASQTSTSSQTSTASATRTASQTASATSTASATNTATSTSTATQTPTSSRSATSSRSSTASVSATATNTASNTGTPSASQTASRTSTGSSSQTASRSATPSRTASRTGTSTRTAPVTPYPTPTPSPSLSWRPFWGSVVAVRVGDETGVRTGWLNTRNTRPGTAMPVWLDYIEVTPARRWFTLPVRRTPEGGQQACTLTYADPTDGTPASTALDWGAQTEGQPGHDNSSVTMFFGCHTTPAGQPLNRAGLKTIAILPRNATGAPDTRMAFQAYNGRRGSATGFRGVYSPDGERFWTIGIADSLYGLRYLASRSATAATRVFGSTFYANGRYQLGSLDIRGVAVSNGYLFLSSSGLVEPAANQGPLAWVGGSVGRLPTVSTGTADVTTMPGLEATVPGFGGRSYWGFVFEYDGRTLWAIEDRCTYVRVPAPAGVDDSARPEFVRTALKTAVVKFRRSMVNGGLTWAPDYSGTRTFYGEAVYSLAGRYRDYSSVVPSGPFVLYTASASRVYELDTGTNALRVLQTAPAGTQYRGVGLQPTWVTPTPSATRSRSRTPPATGTRTRTRKAKA
jgi:hypothetical protein